MQQHLRAFEGRDGAAELRDAVLRIAGDGLLPDGYDVDHVDSEGLWVIKNGRTFPLRQMSDGFRTVAALVVDVVRQAYDAFDRLDVHDGVVGVPGVVLIDEVDAHLHVS